MKKTTQEQDPQASTKLREMVRDIGVAMVTTVTPDGALRSRPMITLDFGEEGQLWFLMSDHSEKARDVAEEQAINASYADPANERYVSVSGNAQLLRDKEKIHELWNPLLAKYFSGGVDDPNLVLLRVSVEMAEYWDAEAGGMRPVIPPTQVEGDSRNDEHVRVDIRASQTSG